MARAYNKLGQLTPEAIKISDRLNGELGAFFRKYSKQYDIRDLENIVIHGAMYQAALCNLQRLASKK